MNEESPKAETSPVDQEASVSKQHQDKQQNLDCIVEVLCEVDQPTVYREHEHQHR
eukprot:CAMPEP_0204915186 /NCGR_PEP_ID=MMETSP1397-20131031/13227_1 /ASSEMBLY_ACC=CAM_ASM_000891 /TAXON_ID=49980 /ORGANISM="Climacostomum Climacostomum virens, Strain Stock W-24" /LENGTH=54 /DNA_ID=CAMNT_0052087107 /DNA_START=15 /DNA_END=175 /DNA_ORIENTATION=+